MFFNDPANSRRPALGSRRRWVMVITLVLLSVAGSAPLPSQDTVHEPPRSTVVDLAAVEGKASPHSSWRTETDGIHRWMVWRGEGLWGEGALPYAAVGAERRLTFQFSVHRAGSYRLKVLNRHLHQDGDNDVWASVNGSPWIKFYDWQTERWSWDETGSWGAWRLEPGEHTLQLGGRSPGFQISRLVLFCDGATDPEEWVAIGPVVVGGDNPR